MVAGDPENRHRIRLSQLPYIFDIPIQEHPSDSCGSRGAGDLGQGWSADRFENNPVRTRIGLGARLDETQELLTLFYAVVVCEDNLQVHIEGPRRLFSIRNLRHLV